MKRELNDARESIQQNLLVLLDGLPQEAQTKACELIVQGFAPLYEELASRVRKSMLVTQIGEAGFRIERTTNLLDIKVGKTLPRDEIEKYMADGITINVTRNK
jgi:hypothetical protein